jgi:rhodanese-related sulfurtransferase
MKLFKICLFILSAIFLVNCESNDPPDVKPDLEGTTTTNPAKVEHVDATGAAKLLASDENFVVLDVRTPEEFSEGHIEGATMIDFKSPDFENNIGKLDRDQSYLIHCRSGGRSTGVLPVFEKLGFKRIIHLDGGFNAWQDAGNPVVK